MSDLRGLLALIPATRRNEHGVVIHEASADEDQTQQIDAIRACLERIVSRLEGEAEAAPEAAPQIGEDGIPEAFRGLMMDGESPERFTERMRRRWQALQHLRIDGTKPSVNRSLPDMTEEEDEEMRDLERRNKESRWLD